MINQTPHSTCNKLWHVPGYIQYLTDNVGVIGNKPQQCNETCEILRRLWAMSDLPTYHLWIYTDICKSTWVPWVFINLYKWGKMSICGCTPRLCPGTAGGLVRPLAETASAYTSPLFWLRPCFVNKDFKKTSFCFKMIRELKRN